MYKNVTTIFIKFKSLFVPSLRKSFLPGILDRNKFEKNNCHDLMQNLLYKLRMHVNSSTIVYSEG